MPDGEIDPSKVINELNARLSARDMQLATLQFKLTMEDEPTEFLESFYGVGYVFQTILNSGPQIKNYFLKTGKLVVGVADEKESCWLSFCGWYIIADGMHSIHMVQIEFSDFDVAETVDAQELYERHYLFQDSPVEQNARNLRMS